MAGTRTGRRISSLPEYLFPSLLVRGAGWLRAEPGCVLEDALRAGVVDELIAADQALFHRESAPGAEAIWEIGWGRRLVRFWGSDIAHIRYSLRPPRTLSIDRGTPDRLGAKKKFLHPLSCEKFRGIVRTTGQPSELFHPPTERCQPL